MLPFPCPNRLLRWRTPPWMFPEWNAQSATARAAAPLVFLTGATRARITIPTLVSGDSTAIRGDLPQSRVAAISIVRFFTARCANTIVLTKDLRCLHSWIRLCFNLRSEPDPQLEDPLNLLGLEEPAAAIADRIGGKIVIWERLATARECADM
jgi:hypothetical protein